MLKINYLTFALHFPENELIIPVSSAATPAKILLLLSNPTIRRLILNF